MSYLNLFCFSRFYFVWPFSILLYWSCSLGVLTTVLLFQLQSNTGQYSPSFAGGKSVLGYCWRGSQVAAWPWAATRSARSRSRQDGSLVCHVVCDVVCIPLSPLHCGPLPIATGFRVSNALRVYTFMSSCVIVTGQRYDYLELNHH